MTFEENTHSSSSQLSYVFTHQDENRFEVQIQLNGQIVAIASVRRMKRSQDDEKSKATYAMKMINPHIAGAEDTIKYVRRLSGVIVAWTHLKQLSFTPILPDFVDPNEDVLMDAEIIKELEDEAKNQEDTVD